jgi:hypothetical protein
MLSRFVIKLYFVFSSLTDERLDPGTASLMIRGLGFPVTVSLVIGFTSIVKLWVTLLLPDCAQTVPVVKSTNRIMLVKILTIERLE